MRLIKAEYSEFKGSDKEWAFEPATFGEINLIVGKNASGKTRLLNVLGSTAKLLSGKQAGLFATGDYKITLSHENRPAYEYELSLDAGSVVREVLTSGNEDHIRREGSGPGRIKTAPKQELMDFQIKPTQLAIVAKRDSLQYPYIEEIASWAEQTEHYEFAALNIGSGRAIGIPGMMPPIQLLQDLEKPLSRDYPHKEYLQILFAAGLQKFGDTFKHAIFADMKKLGYELDDAGIGVISNIPMTPPPIGIWVRETGMTCNTEQTHMSWGMFRALAAVIRMNLAVLAEAPSAVFLDDVGEGLDYERSVALLKLLIEKAKQAPFQLFMSSNDRFVMNEVPFEYWKVVLRTGSRLRIKNYENSRDEFRKFQKLGLNNFDYFVSQTARK